MRVGLGDGSRNLNWSFSRRFQKLRIRTCPLSGQRRVADLWQWLPCTWKADSLTGQHKRGPEERIGVALGR
jgi:hypothetical protein